MEQVTIMDKTFMKKIIKRTNNYIQGQIISFLDFQTITNIYEVMKATKANEYIFQLATYQYLLQRFLNKVDRSLFFIFYEEKQFIKIEKKESQNIAAIHAKNFHSFPIKFDEVLKRLNEQLKLQQNASEIVQSIQTLFFNSDLPLPNLKQQTVAMYSESSLQLFLAELKFPPSQDNWIDSPLQNLKNKMQQTLQNHLKQFISIKQKNQPDNLIIKTRYCSHQITAINYEQYLIQGFQLHNIIVILFALMDNLAVSYYEIISVQIDPFMRFIEFCLRYSIFRNVIIGVQSNLGFLFKIYDQLFIYTYPSYVNQPKFKFWRPSMHKWFNLMQKQHQHSQIIYQYILTMQRNKNILELINSQIEQLPSIYSSIHNKLSENKFAMNLKTKLYDNYQKNGEIFFQKNPELYEILMKDYVQYLIDVSIDEITVHWCGYSAQYFPKKSAYSKFMDQILTYNEKYQQYLFEIVSQKCVTDIQMTITKQIIQIDMEFISGKFIKPSLSKNMVLNYNHRLKNSIQNTNHIFCEQQFDKYRLKMDFNYKDNLLTYFNAKSQIQPRCLFKFVNFYQIANQLSFEQMRQIIIVKMEGEAEQNSDTGEQYISSQQDNMEIEK